MTDIGWLRAHCASLMQELIAVLPDVAKQRVQSIPLAIDDTPGEVNAFAACNGSSAVMVVTDGLLDITAHLAQAKANDDVFGTRTLDTYINLIAQVQKPNQPVAQPPPGFFAPAQQLDPRRVARQHDVLDETLGFILGHELAHHHLGHLPCTGGPGPLGMGEVVRGISSSAPIFNQPNEVAADTAGTDTILSAGARRRRVSPERRGRTAHHAILLRDGSALPGRHSIRLRPDAPTARVPDPRHPADGESMARERRRLGSATAVLTAWPAPKPPPANVCGARFARATVPSRTYSCASPRSARWRSLGPDRGARRIAARFSERLRGAASGERRSLRRRRSRSTSFRSRDPVVAIARPSRSSWGSLRPAEWSLFARRGTEPRLGRLLDGRRVYEAVRGAITAACVLGGVGWVLVRAAPDVAASIGRADSVLSLMSTLVGRAVFAALWPLGAAAIVDVAVQRAAWLERWTHCRRRTRGGERRRSPRAIQTLTRGKSVGAAHRRATDSRDAALGRRARQRSASPRAYSSPRFGHVVMTDTRREADRGT